MIFCGVFTNCTKKQIFGISNQGNELSPTLNV